MNAPQVELAAALRERLAIIADETSRRDPDRHRERLRSVSEKISELGRSLSPPVDPQLAHYLAHSSYDKALALLER